MSGLDLHYGGNDEQGKWQPEWLKCFDGGGDGGVTGQSIAIASSVNFEDKDIYMKGRSRFGR